MALFPKVEGRRTYARRASECWSPEANITNNHPRLTGKIVLAHIKEFPEYSRRLEVLEIEGDLHEALREGNTAELSALSRKLAAARLELAQALVEDLKP